jgi:tRNA G46 methylase TrmB
MITNKEETEIDYTCHKGESLQKAALQSPEKYYIPLECYERLAEKCRESGRELSDVKNMNYLWKWIAVFAFGAGVLIGDAKW